MTSVVIPLLFIIPPIIGILITFISGKMGMNSARKELQHDLKIDEKISKVTGKFIVMIQMPSVGVIYSLAIFMLGHSSSYEISDKLWMALGANMGISALLVAVAMAIIINMGIKEVIKDQMKFGKYLTLMVLPETSVIFAFSIAFLTLGNDAGSVHDLMRANYIMIISSAGAILGAVMMRIMGPINDDGRNFGRIITYGTMGSMISIIVFAFAFMTLGSA